MPLVDTDLGLVGINRGQALGPCALIALVSTTSQKFLDKKTNWSLELTFKDSSDYFSR